MQEFVAGALRTLVFFSRFRLSYGGKAEVSWTLWSEGTRTQICHIQGTAISYICLIKLCVSGAKKMRIGLVAQRVMILLAIV